MPIIILASCASSGSTSDTADAPGRNITTDAILSRWASDKDIDTRVAILQSLTESVVLQDGALAFLDLLAQGLNDYTTTARGDVGSHVRLGALRATRCIWRSLQSGGSARQQEYLRAAVSKLYLNVLRLAAEKLDRVRTEAQAVLSLTLTPSYAVWFNKLTFSSRTYLLALLTFYAQDEYIHPLIMELARADPGAWMAELLAGYVTSADTGNEDLVIAARAALTEYCSMAPANRDDVDAGTLHRAASAAHGRLNDGSLDIVIRVEIDQHDKEGKTDGYGLTVPLLHYTRPVTPAAPFPQQEHSAETSSRSRPRSH
ncbi:hypothetical protein HYQ44_004412 [Verticillium longisporum]|nr:hypothetical protein HYQ44_004412 [Verticillium longisporum]